jgi:pimeloyl-ACP methyl ester carboxylesterase
MKNYKFTPPQLYSAIKILFILLLSFNSFAQNDKDLKDALSKLDTTSFKGKAFLNKAFFIKSLIAPLQKKEKNKDGTPILTLTPQHFQMLTNIIEKADLKDKVKPKSITDFQNRNIDQITSNNIIPIGIINADALFLTQEQLDNNTKAKSQSQAVDGKSYENIEMIVAGLMQGEIYQGNVSFQISPKLIQENINNPILNLEIDFQDGKGYQKFEFKEQLIPHQFKTIGEVAIAIKLVTKRGTYLTYNILRVNQLERPMPYSDKKVVTATKVIQDTNKGARIADNVTGAEYAIYTGCDNVFDKPIIIAEGFDAGQNVNIDVLVAKYYPYLYAFRNNGYDLVFVNYNDGRDYIQNNAQVLKRVIREVNSRKTGNNKLTVIGESMSGLVARWALKEMENQGETHNVSHFISFDAPHKGANVPPGFAKLRRFASNAAYPWSLAFDNINTIFNIIPFLSASETPAARQLLLYSTEVGPHPEYIALQNSLSTLGYPSQAGIRNIAMINGALNGAPQNSPNSGDKMLEANYFYFVANVSANVWSNQVNQSTKVFEGFSWILIPPSLPAYETLSVTTPRNLDRVSGGNISFDVGEIATNFSFANTFSTIDYRGALNNDTDYTIQVFDLFNFNSAVALTDANFRVKADKQNLTPFSSIYGNYTTNTEHALPLRVQNGWNELAVREGYGITNANGVIAGCTLPLPPSVLKTTLGTSGYVNSILPSSICKKIGPDPWRRTYINTLTVTIPDGNRTSNYVQFVRVVGNTINRQYPVDINNRAFITYNDYPVGNYTVSAVRQFYGTSTGEVSVSSTLRVSGSCRIGTETCPTDEDEGEIMGLLTDVNKDCFAFKRNGIWVSTLEDGTFIPRSRLIANGWDVNGANCFAETDPSGGLPACQCGFTLLSTTQNSGQYTGQYTFNSCNASSHKWQLLSGATEIANNGASPYTVTSSTVPITIPSTVNTGSYTLKVDAANCTGSSSLPFSYTKPGGGGNTLSLSQNTWLPSSTVSSQNVTVTSNISWSASTDSPTWLTVSPGSGSITLSATANGSTSPRTGIITVSGAGVTSQTVTVTQAGSGGGLTCPIITTANCGNASEGYTHTFNITQAGDYKFKITYASGESNATGSITVDSDPSIQFSVGPSTGSWTPSSEVYVGTVQKTFTTTGNHTVRIAGVNGVSGSTFAYNKLCPEYTTGGGNTLSLSQSTWLPSSTASSQNVTVTSNISWSASTDSPT